MANMLSTSTKFQISTKIILKHSKFCFCKSNSGNWLALKLLCQHYYFFKFFDNPTSTWLLSHTLPLQLYLLLYVFTLIPLLPGSWVVHYHCIYNATIYFVILLVLNPWLHPPPQSYITTAITSLIPFVFILIRHTTLVSLHLLGCNFKFCLNVNLEKYELYTKILRWWTWQVASVFKIK